LTVTTAKNKALWNAVTPYLKAGNFAGAMQVTQKSGAAIAQIMTYGLNRVRSGAPPRGHRAGDGREPHGSAAASREAHALSRDVREHGDADGPVGHDHRLDRRVHGRLEREPAEKAELLSRSISIGMNCTAFGLMVAIPLVLIHSMLQTKTTAIIDSLEMASVKFLNAISERAQEAKAAHGLHRRRPRAAPRLTTQRGDRVRGSIDADDRP
jgi:hypothetical protein